MLADARWSPGACEVVGSDEVLMFGLEDKGVKFGALLIEEFSSGVLAAKPSDFCMESQITQFSQGSVDNSFGSKLGEEYLDAVILESFSGIWCGWRLREGAEFAAVSWVVEALSSFDARIVASQVISDPFGGSCPLGGLK